MAVTFSDEVFQSILNRISSGESVASICSDEDMPSQRSFYNWLNDSDELVQSYVRAREAQADHIFDEILDIADNASNDWMARSGEKSDGYELHGEHIQRSKLRIEARKWMAGKMAPKKYGDRVQLEHDGAVKVDHSINPQAKLTEFLSAIKGDAESS